MSVEQVWCVVPAAGEVVPIGRDRPWHYAELAGASVLEHTLRRLAAHPRIAGVAVAIERDDAHWPKIEQLDGKPVIAVTGGYGRSESVMAAARALPATVGERDYVLVHDPARPCVRADDITRLIDAVAGSDGGLLGAPLRESLKRPNDKRCSEQTEPPAGRWRAFAPQLFRRGELTRVMQAVVNRGWTVSDEAMAMEIAGYRPLLVEGAEDNVKVASAIELAYAGFLLGATH